MTTTKAKFMGGTCSHSVTLGPLFLSPWTRVTLWVGEWLPWKAPHPLNTEPSDIIIYSKATRRQYSNMNWGRFFFPLSGYLTFFATSLRFCTQHERGSKLSFALPLKFKAHSTNNTLPVKQAVSPHTIGSCSMGQHPQLYSFAFSITLMNILQLPTWHRFITGTT